MPLVLIIVAIGAMVVIGLLGYASGLLRAGGNDADTLKELYAADAGIAHMKKLLELGAATDDISSIEVNGFEVTIVVTPVGTPGAAVPTPQPHPVDPEMPEVLLSPRLVTLRSVPEGTKVDISWAFTQLTPMPTPVSTPTYPSVAVFAGVGGGTPVATSEPLSEVIPGRKYWRDLEDVELLDVETYVVEFDPGTVSDLVSDPFTQDHRECDRPIKPQFCIATPPMDYIVVSKAGQTTVTAYLRQMPQWIPGIQGGTSYTFSGGEVITLSWKPYPPDE